MNIDNNTPYANLDPILILDAVESVGFVCTGSLLALNSYENRVYQIGIENAATIIAKFYRPNRWSNESILEEHQFSLELTEYEIPVVAPWMTSNKETLHEHRDYRFALFPRWGGRALEVDSLDQLEWMGRFIGRFHAVSACKPFQHRSQLTVQNQGYHSFQYLIEQHLIPEYLTENYRHIVTTVLQQIDHIFNSVGSIKRIRLHGDLHAGNVLWNDAGPHIVDLDDCLTGPAIQDFWMLLSGDESHVKIQLDRILKGYCEFHDFNPRELHLIEPLRTLRMLQYSAWLAKRWEDPAFPPSFPWFNTPRYWEEHIRHLQEQLELLNSCFQL